MTTEKLTKFCLSLPGVTQGIKWEDHLCFMLADKMFCITGLTDDSNVSIKIDVEAFEDICERDGITPSRYLSRYCWISIEKRNALKPKEWEHFLIRSYELVKSKLSKKVQQSLR